MVSNLLPRSRSAEPCSEALRITAELGMPPGYQAVAGSARPSCMRGGVPELPGRVPARRSPSSTSSLAAPVRVLRPPDHASWCRCSSRSRSGVLTLVLAGKTLNIYAIMGMFLLIGVGRGRTRSSRSTTRTSSARAGCSRLDAQLAGGPGAARPILMTTLAIVVRACCPSRSGRGDGRPPRAPCAIAVVGGRGPLPGRDARHHTRRLLVLRRPPRLAPAAPRLAAGGTASARARPAAPGQA